MNTFIVLAALLAAAMAAPEQLVSVAQDTLGNYNLRYTIDGIARTENRDIHGNVDGHYAYIDPYGILRKTEYTAGVLGFNAVGTDIPQPVQDTPEVAHAKAEHLSILRAAHLSAPPQPLEVIHPELFEGPALRTAQFAGQPGLAIPQHAPLLHHGVHQGAIPETPEVLAARAEHFAAHAAARGQLLRH